MTAAAPGPGVRLGALPVAAGAGLALGLVAAALAAASPGDRPLLLVAAALPLAAALVTDGRRLLLVVVVMDVPLGVDRFFAYREGPAALGAVGGAVLSASAVAIVCLWALRLAGPVSEASPADRRIVRRTMVPLVVLTVIAGASVAVATDRALALFGVLLLVHVLAVGAYVATALRDRRDLLLAAGAMVAGVLSQGLLAVGVLAGLPAFTAGGLELRVDVDGGVERFGGTVGSPNTAAAFLALFLPVCLALAVAPAGRGLRRLGMCAFALGLVALVMTLGRGGWVSTLIGIAVFVVIANRRRWPGTTALAGPLALMVLLVAVLGGAVATRLSADDGGAAASRIPLLEIAATMARDHPLLGVGANNEAVAAEPYRTRDVASRWDYTVHNTYALVLVETGVGGLLAFVAFLGGGIANGRRAMAEPDDPVPAVLAAGLTAGLVGVMVNMLSEPLNGRASLQGLVLVVALLTAMAAAARAGTAAP